MKRRFFPFLFFFFLPLNLWSAPKDFRVIYFSSAGSMEKATTEKVTVQEGSATMDRDAVQVGGTGEKEKFSKAYKVSSEQLEALYLIVQASGILAWPVSPETPHQSQVEEYFEVTADRKTVRRTRWEGGNLEGFRKFYEDFNKWYTDIRSVKF